MIKLYALMHEENGEWKLAHRQKRVFSMYSQSANHRPLVYNTRKKAEHALNSKPYGNFLPEGTVIVELDGEPK